MDKWFSALSLGYTLIASSIFGYLNKPTEMGLAIVAGAIAMAFANIDKIKRFKGAGFEAEMKEIEEAVKHAYATIDNLTKVADPLIRCTAYQLTWGNRLSGGMEENEARDIFKQLDEICASFALQNPQYQLIKDQYDKLHGLDRLRGIINNLNKTLNIDQSIINELQAYQNMTSPLPTKSDIQRILGSIYQQAPPELSQAIDDYEIYIERHAVDPIVAPAIN